VNCREETVADLSAEPRTASRFTGGGAHLSNAKIICEVNNDQRECFTEAENLQANVGADELTVPEMDRRKTEAAEIVTRSTDSKAGCVLIFTYFTCLES